MVRGGNESQLVLDKMGVQTLYKRKKPILFTRIQGGKTNKHSQNESSDQSGQEANSWRRAEQREGGRIHDRVIDPRLLQASPFED